MRQRMNVTLKNIIQDDDYKSPWKNEYATVATSLTTVKNPFHWRIYIWT